MLSGKSSAVAVMTVVLMCGASSASAQTYTIIGDSSRVTINDKLVVSARDSSVTYERRDISAWVADLSGPSRHDSVLALWAAFPPLELIANPLTGFGGPGPFRATEGIAGLLNQGRHAEVKLLANRTVSAHIEVVLSELTKLVVNEAESLSLRDNAASALSAILGAAFNPSDKEQSQKVSALKAAATNALKLKKDLSERRRQADEAQSAALAAQFKTWDAERRERTIRKLNVALAKGQTSVYDARQAVSDVRIFYLKDLAIVGLSKPLLIPVLIDELSSERPSVCQEAAEDLGKIGTFAEPALSALRTAAANDPDKGVRKAASKAVKEITKALKRRP